MGLIFGGQALIYGGLWLLAKPLPGPGRLNLALAFATAFVIYRGRWRSFDSPPQIVLAALSVACFLLNPLFFSYLLWTPDSAALRDAFLSVVFCGALFWLDHWSVLMRAAFLAVLFAAALWLGSAVVFWIPVAFVPWVLFNRRPPLALGCLFMIVGGGAGLYSLSWGILDVLIRGHAPWPGPFFGAIHQEVGRWALAVLSSGSHKYIFSGALLSPLGFATWLFSLPLVLLVVLVTGVRLIPTFQNRRADALTFQIVLIWTIALFWFCDLYAGGPFRDGDLISCVALTASLLVRVVEARNLILSRSIRKILVVSAVIALGVTSLSLYHTSAAVPPQTPWLGLGLSLAGLFLAFLVSFGMVSVQKVNAGLRVSAILVGSYLGFCFGFFSQFFRP
jgi:hypothetical protein